jgi:type III restriction enzyme
VDKCQVDRIVLDSDWEAAAAQDLEAASEVVAYVRNERLGFEIPYVVGNEERFYRPDFFAVLEDGLRAVLEVNGQRRPEDAAKFAAARGFWVPAVNAVGGFGRWTFAVADGKYGVRARLRRWWRGVVRGLERGSWKRGLAHEDVICW